ncbi:MAG: two-component system sensor histidine kinase NtrB [Desulfovibrio sp.]|uniref:two-component system sensor histidine kinase NtrB n=1 Tax=Desulfovibrio sp. 7SRBS1 TaxID=3378064 RepID=UPI003B41CB1B
MLLAALALSLLCAGLVFFTWDGLRRQRNLLDEHVTLTSRVIMRGMQANLLRSMRPMRGHARGGHGRMAPPSDELFQEIARDGNVQFMAVVGPKGTVLYSSPGGLVEVPRLSERDMGQLREFGEWSAPVRWEGRELLISGMRAHPLLSSMCRDDDCGPGKKDVYFLIGLDLHPYLVQYNKFRRGALIQMGFVIGAAALLMILLTTYVRHREEGRRLASLEEVHFTLLDAMPDGLISLDEDDIVRTANQSAVRILKEPGLVGRPWATLGLDMTQGDADTGWTQCEHHGRKLEILRRRLDDPDTPGSLILVRDRTVFKHMEERLVNAEKLAAVGRMAAGAAHEIRNPLSSLRGFAQFFMKKFKGTAPEEEYAATMVREADRLNKVITNMLFLAKPRPLEPCNVNLEAMAREVSSALAPDIAETGVKFGLELGIQEVQADSDALKQALINLVVNSLGVVGNMPEEGRQGEVVICSGNEDGVPWVGVRDNGPGMSDEETQRALEPFFTTRKDGTGLGLAIVDSIMRDHQGRVDIASVPGEGTTVRLLFG